MAGQSTALGDTLLLFDIGTGVFWFANPYVAAHPADVDVTYRPVFRAQSTSLFSVTGHGITVDIKTGRITIAATLPSPRKHNFIVEVEARNVGGTETFRERIRVHVHGSVKPNHVWLTPPRLTVRPDGTKLALLSDGTSIPVTNYRFSLRAEFDDDVGGDLTLGHDATWGPPTHVMADGKLRVPAGAAAGATATITATLPPALGGQSATAKMVFGAPWASDLTRPQAELMAGGGWPGTTPPEHVPNILFFAAGLIAIDREAFVAFTDRVVARLRSSSALSPYNYLCPSINFWRLWLPVTDRSLSVRTLEAPVSMPGGFGSWAVPAVVEPPSTGALDISHLLYAVGLPVPSQQGTAVATLRTEWTLLTTVDLSRVTDTVIEEWKEYGGAAVVAEFDTFPGISIGVPPAANVTSETILALHEDRAGPEGLDALFASVTAKSGITLSNGDNVGTLWTSTAGGFRFNNSRFVILVTASRAGRANGGFRVTAPSPREAGTRFLFEFLPGRREVRVSVPPPGSKPDLDYISMIAHELGHQFYLENEYADFARAKPHTADELAENPNVQPDVDARVDGKLKGDEIKWNWHRIAKAARSAGPITPAGTGFVVPVTAPDGLQFAVDEVVLLRVRQQAVPLMKKQLVFPAKLTVTAVQPDAVRVKADAIAPDFSPFGDGAILFVPVPRHPRDLPGPEPHARLVTNLAKAYIDANNVPLTGPPCEHPDALVGAEPQVPTDLPVPLFLACNKDLTRVVGLYEGGHLYACGVYHPTGWCKMRDDGDVFGEFCIVCKYALVDFVDPRAHGLVERDYARTFTIP